MLRQVAISCLVALFALPSMGRTRPHYGGTLHIEVAGDAWQRPGGMALRLVLDGLTTMGSDGRPEPALAVRWEAENGDHRWQFWLRPGVHFQDGTALTAAVVESSLAGSCGASCPWTALHAVGSTVVFTGDAPLPNLPAMLAGDDFLIGIVGQGPDAVVGTGAFAPSGGVATNGVQRLAANESCWQGRPFLDAIEITSHKPIRDQWLDLSVGRADLVEVPAEELRLAREQHLTVTSSPPVTLLALAVADSGVLGNPNLRAAMALAVDRGALSNIFQKQGAITGSLLPAGLTGYSFLFPAGRDVNKARELRGGLTTPPLTLGAEGDGAMQLAAQRIALDLHEAGFNVQASGGNGARHTDIKLVKLRLGSTEPQAALELMLRGVGVATPVLDDTPGGLYRVERDFLETHTLIPLLYLPRAYAVGPNVRDLRLSLDGTPLVAGASLEGAP